MESFPAPWSSRATSSSGVSTRPHPHRIPETHAHRRIVLVCQEGYSSSLAARTLRDLGLARATDLVGGYVRWKHGGDAGS